MKPLKVIWMLFLSLGFLAQLYLTFQAEHAENYIKAIYEFMWAIGFAYILEDERKS